jgi:uncharacterized protein involved in type VI secretion and phage assembly
MPDAALEALSHFYLKLNGQQAPSELQSDLIEVHVESSLHLPDAATLVFNDLQMKWLDHDDFLPGKALEIEGETGSGRDVIFRGEIVEIEPHLSADGEKILIRAFDKLHRLTRGRYVRSFVNMSDADIIKKVIQESGAGLQAQVGETGEVHDLVLQANQTNLEFLQSRAAKLGYFLYADGDTIHCEPLPSDAEEIELKLHETLGEFRPRLSTSEQLSEVTARGWNYREKAAVSGVTTRGEEQAQIGYSTNGGLLANQAHNVNAKMLINQPVVRSQRAAEDLAKTVANRRSSRFIEAEGNCGGNPMVMARTKVKITGVGTRFSGHYFVTSATHAYTTDGGYSTVFSVTGHHPENLLSILGQDREYRIEPTIGIGIVTDNQDPHNMGRVKVKYPWLSDQDTSDWARVIAPGAGAERGIMYIPEVNDEVLVGFEAGDIDHPYVLGGLWNGNDAPPLSTSEAVKSSNVAQRIIKSRTGHVIILDDSDDKPGIYIRDKTGSNLIEIDSTTNAMKIHIDGDTEIKARGNLKLESQQEITIKAQMGLKMDGGPSAELKAINTNVKADAALDLSGTATAKLSSSGMTDVQGSLVKINS